MVTFTPSLSTLIVNADLSFNQGGPNTRIAQATNDSTALFVAPITGVGLGVFFKNAGGVNQVSVIIPGGTQAKVVGLIRSHFDESFRLMTQFNNDVYFCKISSSGIVLIPPSSISSGSADYAFSVLSDGNMVLLDYSTDANNSSVIIRATKLDSFGLSHATTVYSDTIGAGAVAPIQRGNLFTRSKANSSNLIVVLNFISGNESLLSSQIIGLTLDITHMEFVQIGLIYSFNGVPGNIWNCFDDLLAPNGIWLVHSGTALLLSDPPLPTAPNNTQYVTVRIVSPSATAGFADYFPPAITYRSLPATVPNGPVPPGDFFTSPVFPTANAVFNPANGDIYCPGTDLNFVSPTYQRPFIYIWNRASLIIKQAVPPTIDVVTSVPLTLAGAITGQPIVPPVADGTASSFFAIESDSAHLGFIRTTSNDIPGVAPSPDAQVGPTFDVATIGAIPQLNLPSQVLCVATNANGDVAVAYISNLNLKLIVRLAGGIVTSEFIVSNQGNAIITDLINGLVSDNNEWVITYTYYDTNSGTSPTSIVRIKNDLSGYSAALPSPLPVITVADGFLSQKIFTKPLTPTSYLCIFDFTMGANPTQIGARIVDLNPLAVPFLIFTVPNNQSSVQFATGILAGNAQNKLIAIDCRNPLAATPFTTTVLTLQFSPTFALSPVMTFAASTQGSINDLRSFSAHDDNLGPISFGLWVQSVLDMAATTFIRSGLMVMANPPMSSAPVLNSSFSNTSLVAPNFVQDASGNLYGVSLVLGNESLKREIRQTGHSFDLATDPIAGLSLAKLLLTDSAVIAGDATLFYAISQPVSGTATMKVFERTDVPGPSPNLIMQGSVLTSVSAPVTPSPTRTGPIEMPSVAINALGETAVLRFDPVDSSGGFQRKGRLFLDILDSSFFLLGSAQLTDETDPPIIIRNDDFDVRNQNSAPSCVALPGGDFIVCFGKLLSLQGDAQFFVTRIDRTNIQDPGRLTYLVSADSAWAAKISVFPDDRFAVSYTKWIPDDDVSETRVQIFNSLGLQGGPISVYSGGLLNFEKEIVAIEKATSGHWMIVFSQTVSSTDLNKQYVVASASVPGLAQLSPRKYEFVGSFSPDRIVGVADFDNMSLWVDEGSAISRIEPTFSDVYHRVFELSGDHLVPTKFMRAVYDVDHNMYGVKTAAVPNILRLRRAGVKEFLGELRFTGNPLATGTFFLDAALDGTGERMVVPVYTDSSLGSYSILTMAQNVTPAQPPPIVNPPVLIAQSFLPLASLSIPYPPIFVVYIGVGPVNFSASNLPPGLTISSSGIISGTPTQLGTFAVEISAQNSGGISTKVLNLTVGPCVPSVGLIETGGPFSGGPAVSGQDVLVVPHVMAGNAAEFWTAHVFRRNFSNGIMLQRHLSTGLRTGNSILVQTPINVLQGQMSVDIGFVPTGGAVVVYGGYSYQISVNPKIVRGPITAVRYDATGSRFIYAPRVITDDSFTGPRLHPVVFVFADGASAVTWYEGSDLKTVVVSPEGIPGRVNTVAQNLNPEITPAITGDVSGSKFYIFYSDGVILNFMQFDRHGTSFSPISVPVFIGETIRSISVLVSPFDESFMISTSIRSGSAPVFDDRVTWQRVTSAGIPLTSRFTTVPTDFAEFGSFVKKNILELQDGTFLITYFRKFNNDAALWRLDRNMIPLGALPSIQIGGPNSNFIGLADCDGTIVWGFHDPLNLNVFLYKVDCELTPPVLPVPPINPSPCRTV